MPPLRYSFLSRPPRARKTITAITHQASLATGAMCYFSGDNAEYFRQQMPIWPTPKERLFMSIPPKKTLPLIAIGLALRPWETACIK